MAVIGNRESGIGHRESGIGNRASGIGMKLPVDDLFVRTTTRKFPTPCSLFPFLYNNQLGV
ncbi:hypothetical protein [Moorena sp. SIO3H5]|uniref:hypothetical protein n=1 Tax=Moorena sp. SIO3H5 TaxID=2607834 RepID=UPI0013BE6A89|nr:hypothetical protein [Moorena sp. SIO3H5]NEO71402.1 hypothetical protein [Moorena sp. SIO3H5]